MIVFLLNRVGPVVIGASEKVKKLRENEFKLHDDYLPKILNGQVEVGDTHTYEKNVFLL